MTKQNPKSQDRLRERNKRALLELQAMDKDLHTLAEAITESRTKIRKMQDLIIQRCKVKSQP